MTRPKIVVSDSSVLMDLAKVRLIEATLALPFEFVIPETIVSQELLDLGSYTSADLLRLGFRLGTLDPDDAGVALAYYRSHRKTLTVNDCIAWRLAEVTGGILMTGDGALRELAERNQIEVHGTVWVAELVGTHDTCSRAFLLEALDQLEADPFVYIPDVLIRELRTKLRKRA